jgi:molybdate transport system substrate-binding protein
MKLLSIFLLAFAVPCGAQEITVAAAADLRPAFEEIISGFQQSHPTTAVKVTFGSSGNFFQQIQNGAPFDVFFSANEEYPRRLESAGLTVPGSYHQYARGKIVLLVSSGSKLDINQGLKVLLDASVKKIAIADPSHAPYGQAAVAALKTEKIYDQLSAKLVTGENISQAASFVLSGAADVGIASLSLALAPATRGQVRYWKIPSSDYPPIQQACVIIKASKNQQLAAQFQTYFRSKEVSSVLERYGFEVPAESKTEETTN